MSFATSSYDGPSYSTRYRSQTRERSFTTESSRTPSVETSTSTESSSVKSSASVDIESSLVQSVKSSTVVDDDSADADAEALEEAMEAIRALERGEPVFDLEKANEANEIEKQWWVRNDYTEIDPDRLPLILARGVSMQQYDDKCKDFRTRKFWDYDGGTVVIYELPSQPHDIASSEIAKAFNLAEAGLPFNDCVAGLTSPTCKEKKRNGRKAEPDHSFTPNRLPTPSPNPCDDDKNPWPTIIVEVAASESLLHVQEKVENFWLLRSHSRSEDVIVLHLGKWNRRYVGNGNNRTPLRRLTCYKYCRTHITQNGGVFQPQFHVEFGTCRRNGRRYYGCSGPNMQLLTISRQCIFAGCPGGPPHAYPVNVVVDLYNVQQYIFRRQRP